MNEINRKRVFKVLKDTFLSLDGEISDDWGPNQIQDWDSLGHLNLVMSLGEEFDVSIDFVEVISIETVGDIYKVLNNKGIE